MQITGGTVAVELGSNVVTGTTVDWSQVLVGNYIIITGLIFEIAAIDLITDPTHPTLTLVEDWPSADNPTVSNYVIQRDFSSQHRLPLLNAGDLEAAALFTRAMMIIDGLLSISGSTTNEITITQSGHDFIVGNALRFNGTDWVKSTTSSSTTAIVVGLVSAIIDANTVRLKTDGYITGIAHTLTPGTVYYLRSTVHASGHNITSTVPGETGPLRVPLLIATSSNSGYLLNLATAQAGEFGLNTPGIVPGPTSVSGTTFLRDDGWNTVSTSNDSITLAHLKKPDPLSSWPGIVDWENWFTNTGALGVWAHINDLHIRLGDVETSVGNTAYTRLVYTRKNRFFGSGDDDTLPLVVPDGVNEVVVTLFSGYTPYSTYVNGRLVYFNSIGCLAIRLSLDTSVNKNLKINVGTRPRYSDVTPLGKATLISTIGGEDVVIARVDKVIVYTAGGGNPPIYTSYVDEPTYELAGSIDGVIRAQIFSVQCDIVNGIYRSVELDPSVADGSWAYAPYGNSNAPGVSDPILVEGLPARFAVMPWGHCGAVIIEYGAGAVFGVV